MNGTGLLLEELSSSDSHLSFQYDTLARLWKTSDELAGGTNPISFDSEYAYDENSRVKRVDNEFNLGGPVLPPLGGGPGPVTSQADFTNEYFYNASSLVEKVVQYDGDGADSVAIGEKLVWMDWYEDYTLENVQRYENTDQNANQFVSRSDYVYDPDVAGRLTSITHDDHNTGDSNYLASYDWTYYNNGLVNVFTANDAATGSTVERDYDYDETQQLTDVTVKVDGVVDSTQTENYAYDANGNRIGDGGFSTNPNTYDSDDYNRIERKPLANGEYYRYFYDDEGNRTSKKKYNSSDEVIEKYRYEWDHRNRLVKVRIHEADGSIGPVESKRIFYTYDALDNRTSKRVTERPTGGSWQQTSEERYLFDHGPMDALSHKVLTLDATNGFGDSFNGLDIEIEERYLHGPMTDQVFAQEADGNVLWALTDHQGTVRDLVDANVNGSGNVTSTTTVNHLDYDGFGNITAQSGTAVSAFTFTGREWDADAGLYNYRGRWYDPEDGAFISDDPTGFGAGDANFSRMVGNSTPNGIDPSGYEEQQGAGLPPTISDSLVDEAIKEGRATKGFRKGKLTGSRGAPFDTSVHYKYYSGVEAVTLILTTADGRTFHSVYKRPVKSTERTDLSILRGLTGGGFTKSSMVKDGRDSTSDWQYVGTLPGNGRSPNASHELLVLDPADVRRLQEALNRGEAVLHFIPGGASSDTIAQGNALTVDGALTIGTDVVLSLTVIGKAGGSSCRTMRILNGADLALEGTTAAVRTAQALNKANNGELSGAEAGEALLRILLFGRQLKNAPRYAEINPHASNLRPIHPVGQTPQSVARAQRTVPFNQALSDADQPIQIVMYKGEQFVVSGHHRIFGVRTLHPGSTAPKTLRAQVFTPEDYIKSPNADPIFRNNLKNLESVLENSRSANASF